MFRGSTIVTKSIHKSEVKKSFTNSIALGHCHLALAYSPHEILITSQQNIKARR